MEYLPEKDVWIKETKMPLSVHGFVCRKCGQIYLFVNADLSDEAKRETLDHEFEHIDNDDLFSEEEAVTIEKGVSK